MAKVKFKTTEYCSHCHSEQLTNKIVKPCPKCGNLLVACSMCKTIAESGCCGNCTNGSNFILATEKDVENLYD